MKAVWVASIGLRFKPRTAWIWSGSDTHSAAIFSPKGISLHWYYPVCKFVL